MPRQRQRKGMRRRTTKSAGKIALRKVNKILSNQEKKKIENADSTNMASTPTIIPLTLVGQGDGGAEREGNSIILKSISGKIGLRMNTAQASGNLSRLMLVFDSQVNNAQFTAGELLQDTTIGDNIVSALNLDGSQRFKVLWNKVVAMSPQGIESAYRTFFKKLNIKARYSGTSANISGVESKGLFFVFMDDNSGNQNVITYNLRIRFADS